MTIDERIADLEAGVTGLRVQQAQHEQAGERLRHLLSANEGALQVLREVKAESEGEAGADGPGLATVEGEQGDEQADETGDDSDDRPADEVA